MSRTRRNPGGIRQKWDMPHEQKTDYSRQKEKERLRKELEEKEELELFSKHYSKTYDTISNNPKFLKEWPHQDLKELVGELNDERFER